jgi:hypothetical protein
MEVILRYAKVSSIKDKTVSIIGVNPPTGKHVEFVFERIDEPTLSSLKYALSSKIFIKMLAGKKGEPDFEFQEERTTETREDSYFTLFSYAKEVGYAPEFLKKLDHYLVTMDGRTKPFKDLGRHILNVTDKLGMIFYAKEQIAKLKETKYPSYIEIRYHIVNAIIACKGCLDALAAILNEVYSIGYRKGKIDLATTRSDLLYQIGKVNQKLGSTLKKHEKWINHVTEYRDFLTHRIMLITLPFAGPTSDASGLMEPIKVQVPSHPLTIDYVENKPISWVDAEDYCQSLIRHLQEIIEIICSDLLKLIESKTYFPT